MKQYIETQRLILRSWQEADIPHLARMNSDDRVMEYFLKTLSYEETIALYNQIQEEFKRYGFGAYAVEERETGAFIGFVGLHNVTFEVDFAPAVEILWRLLPEYWGKGYAAEAAKAYLKYAKDELKLKEIVSFTSLPNKRSEHVMQKIGMTRIKEFAHPLVEPNHPLYRHILYRVDLATSKL
jgi:RimJ/RimL family protein N-acetyltransferase